MKSVALSVCRPHFSFIKKTVALQLTKSAAAQGLWMLGNLVTELPADIGALTSLQTLVVHSNRLAALPDSITALSQLTDLGAAGNRLTSVPDSIGALGGASQTQS